MIRIAANPSPFKQAEAHLVETMFYDQWAPPGENVVVKTQGTFVPRWKDVQDDPEPDLRELLARKKKRKEAPATKPDEVPRCVRIRGLNGKIIYKLWRCVGPTGKLQVGPAQKKQHKSLACCVVEKSLEKEEGKDEAVTAERDI